MKTSLDEKIEKRFRKIKSILLMGPFGVEGISFLTFYERYLSDIPLALYDDRNLDQLNSLKVKEKFSDISLIDFDEYDIVVKSPGIPKKLIPAKYHDKVVNNMSLFIEFIDRSKLFTVTGTKGKGTTCTILERLLTALGFDVILAGNIGVGVLDIIDEVDHKDFIILEVSSFQAQDFRESAKYCGVLKTFVDHIDVHSSVEDYHLAKANMIKHQEPDNECVYYSGEGFAKKIASASRAGKASYNLEMSGAREPNMYYDQVNNVIIYSDDEFKKIITLESFHLPGLHNIENLMAALLLCKDFWLGKSDDEIREMMRGIEEFKGLPMHIEKTQEWNGIIIYNDSFSTTTDTTISALNCFTDKNIILILGGRPRLSQEEYTTLFQEIASRKIKQCIILAKDAEFFEYGLRNANYHQIAYADNMDEAVRIGLDLAEFGDIFLLSPGATSFDLFPNFKERGNLFNQAVSKYIESK